MVYKVKTLVRRSGSDNISGLLFDSSRRDCRRGVLQIRPRFSVGYTILIETTCVFQTIKLYDHNVIHVYAFGTKCETSMRGRVVIGHDNVVDLCHFNLLMKYLNFENFVLLRQHNILFINLYFISCLIQYAPS